MMERLVVLIVASILVSEVTARSLGLSQLQKVKESKRASEAEELSIVGTAGVNDVGQLPTLHAVGIATNPNNRDQLIFADETSLYEFDKLTGESKVIAGQASSGLLSSRTSVDGRGVSAAFKYITKIIARPSGLYIFDYDSLRKYNFNTQTVDTIAQLSDDGQENKPIIGVISSDESDVYWTTTAGQGHMVMGKKLNTGETSLVTGGPTLIGHMELTDDDEYLLLADLDMSLVEKVRIQDGEVTFVTQYGQENFFPGAMAVNGDDLYVINRETASIDIYDITAEQSTPRPLCDESCLEQVSNPFDIIFDSDSNQVYILDGAYHPSLPTYIFSIKTISLTNEINVGGPSSRSNDDVNDMMRLFSRWLTEMKRQ